MVDSFETDTDHSVTFPCNGATLNGILHIPQATKGIVLFVHGSGSGRFSPRNQFVARIMQEAHLTTLLFDLLTPEEDEIDARTREYRFDIDFLTIRLLCATEWTLKNLSGSVLPIGYFGASTGGAAALKAAASKPGLVKAIVSRGGRPDLAGEMLPYVEAPTLLIVGGDDVGVIELNQKALAALKCIKVLEIVPGATHLFEESGKLGQVATLASGWFKKYLVAVEHENTI